MPPVIHPRKCKRCGLCVDLCPEDIFGGSRKRIVPKVKYGEECWYCGACVVDCPAQAISLYIPLPMRVTREE